MIRRQHGLSLVETLAGVTLLALLTVHCVSFLGDALAAARSPPVDARTLDDLEALVDAFLADPSAFGFDEFPESGSLPWTGTHGTGSVKFETHRVRPVGAPATPTAPNKTEPIESTRVRAIFSVARDGSKPTAVEQRLLIFRYETWWTACWREVEIPK